MQDELGCPINLWLSINAADDLRLTADSCLGDLLATLVLLYIGWSYLTLTGVAPLTNRKLY